jgi:hypothetical protein
VAGSGVHGLQQGAMLSGDRGQGRGFGGGALVGVALGGEFGEQPVT